MKVAIVGSAPSSAYLAPYKDPDWEIWGMNEQYDRMDRWDRWFDIHPERLVMNGLTNPKHWDWLIQQTKPVIMNRKYDEIPGCVIYPIDAVKARFGEYFTNSVSYMIAYALLLGVSELAVYGVDMASDSEYGDQRASCEYFIGLARGMGIPVYVPPEAELCKTPYLYGFEEMPEVLQKSRARMLELKGRMEQTQEVVRHAEIEAAYLKGAYENQVYTYKNWTINGSLQKPI